MAVFKDYATRAAEKEAKQAERQAKADEYKRQLKEARHSAVMEEVAKAGLAFDDYDDGGLEDAIKRNIIELNDQISFGGLSDIETLYKTRPETSTDELINVLVKQNWILIQQNERITRLLEGLYDSK